MIEFKAWPKIPRLSKSNVTITEKIDGPNRGHDERGKS